MGSRGWWPHVLLVVEHRMAIGLRVRPPRRLVDEPAPRLRVQEAGLLTSVDDGPLRTIEALHEPVLRGPPRLGDVGDLGGGERPRLGEHLPHSPMVGPDRAQDGADHDPHPVLELGRLANDQLHLTLERAEPAFGLELAVQRVAGRIPKLAGGALELGLDLTPAITLEERQLLGLAELVLREVDALAPQCRVLPTRSKGGFKRRFQIMDLGGEAFDLLVGLDQPPAGCIERQLSAADAPVCDQLV